MPQFCVNSMVYLPRLQDGATPQLTSLKVPVRVKERRPPTSDVTDSLFLGWTLCSLLKEHPREGNAALGVASSTSHIPLWKEMGRPEFSKEVRVLYQKKG